MMQVSTLNDFFLIYLWPKSVKKQVFLAIVDCSKNFLSGCTNNKSELGFMVLTGLPGEAVDSISNYARS